MAGQQARTGRGRTTLESLAVLALALALGLLGATGVGALGCNGDGGTDTVGGGDGGAGRDGGGTQRCTTAEECDDGDECTEDSCSATGVCEHTALTGTTPLYATCTKDCDCETGFCYDEGYMSPFRWCTKPCGGVAVGCGADAENVCLIFSGAWVDTIEPPIVERAICAPVCASDQDCKDLDPAWDACTERDTRLTDPAGVEHTLSLRRTCIKNAE